MGLVRCPDCRREVSSRVEACPHCGGPISDDLPSVAPQAADGPKGETVLTRNRGCGDLLLFVVLGLVLVVLLVVVLA